MRSNPVVASLMGVVAAALMTAPTARAAVSPEVRCQQSRYDAAAKYAQCHQKALGKHFAVNDFAKLNPALSKCRVKYTVTWAKLQKKARGTGATCDAARFVDNGDGTVTDNLTGLDWSKTDDADFVFDKMHF